MKVYMCGGMTPSGKRQCMAEVVRTIGGVALCERHLSNIIRELGGPLAPARHEVTTAVVYYMGDPPTQTVKIGTSTRPLTRWKHLREGRPELVLLAVEPGYFELERERHRQFASSRVDHRRNREWYHKTPELLAHINEVFRAHGDPWKHPALGA